MKSGTLSKLAELAHKGINWRFNPPSAPHQGGIWERLVRITPNHFLLGEYSTGIPSVVGNNEFDYRKRYARAQPYANAIWSRWIREYVPTLNRRSKWQTPAEQHLKTGDLVGIVEESNSRGYYPTARIVELRYGSDNVPRSAILRTLTSSLVRPPVKLVPVFPTSSSGPEDVN